MSHPKEEVKKVKKRLKNGNNKKAVEHLNYLIHGLEKQDRGDSLDSFIRDLKKIKNEAMVDVETALKYCDDVLGELDPGSGSSRSKSSSSDYKIEDEIGADSQDENKELIKASDIVMNDQSHIEEEIERLQKEIMIMEQKMKELEDD
ncbi:hypothetical protein [Natrinema sp. H-ect4]|uniref:hypothetical protein n=1 Tax=Natrinema sp. H-ect4 TaxID=3242699 RepID=UPI0035A90426